MEEYAVALEGLPNEGSLFGWIGYTHRRMGQWDRSTEAYRRATELDPRDADLQFDLGGLTFELTRQYDAAARILDRAAGIAPEVHQIAAARAWNQVRWRGDLGALQEVVSGMPADARFGGEQISTLFQRCILLHFQRDGEGLLREVLRAPTDVFDGQVSFVPVSLLAGWAHQLRADDASAQLAFESARARLDRALLELPDDWRVHAAHGHALAGLGRGPEARHEAEWLRKSEIYGHDAYDGPFLAEDRARILAQAGYADEALDEIERLLSTPSWLSVHTLRLDPRWDPIRTHPRFQALLKRYGR